MERPAVRCGAVRCRGRGGGTSTSSAPTKEAVLRNVAYSALPSRHLGSAGASGYSAWGECIGCHTEHSLPASIVGIRPIRFRPIWTRPIRIRAVRTRGQIVPSVGHGGCMRCVPARHCATISIRPATTRARQHERLSLGRVASRASFRMQEGAAPAGASSTKRVSGSTMGTSLRTCARARRALTPSTPAPPAPRHAQTGEAAVRPAGRDCTRCPTACEPLSTKR